MPHAQPNAETASPTRLELGGRLAFRSTRTQSLPRAPGRSFSSAQYGSRLPAFANPRLTM
jgi:hypothetical protein